MLPSQFAEITQRWTGHLLHYHTHQNSEHVDALLEEAAKFCGRLESFLAESDFWAELPLMNRVELLLFLVDRGLVQRQLSARGYSFRAVADAEEQLIQHSGPRPYLVATLELLAAIRLARRTRCPRP